LRRETEWKTMMKQSFDDEMKQSEKRVMKNDDDEQRWESETMTTMMIMKRWWWNETMMMVKTMMVKGRLGFLHVRWNDETMLRETVKLDLGKNTRFLWFRVKSISGYQITRPVCTAPSPIWSPIRPSTTFPLQAREPNHETAGKRTWSWTKHAKPPSARKNVRTYVLARVFDYIAYGRRSSSLLKTYSIWTNK
jgi:hypothetical protein